MYEFVCRNCGKRNIGDENYDRIPKMFCDRECYNEYHQKKREEEEKMRHQSHSFSQTKTPASQCKKCVYGCSIGGLWSCGYFDSKERHTRHFLHPDGLPDECQEFERRRKERKPKAYTIKKGR